jgi:triosephosphate isomerase
MRKPIIAGNWKMHKTPSEAADFVAALARKVEAYNDVERVVIPSFVALPGAAEAARGTAILIGAQDVHHEEKGAFTSCIAASMLVGLVEYVIVGHSETRQYLNVTDELVNKKAKNATGNRLAQPGHGTSSYHARPHPPQLRSITGCSIVTSCPHKQRAAPKLMS